MKSGPSLHPLQYIAATLGQMAAMLRDFDMPDSAQLLEKVKSDIELKLAADPEQETPKKGRSSFRDPRGT
jgi:hypothetical protein